MDKVVAFDPGGSTGVAVRDTLGTITTFCWINDDHHQQLWRWLNENEPQHVVYERFVYQRREIDKGVSLELISREYIGIIRLWGQVNREWCDAKLYPQNVSDAKGFISDDNIKKLTQKTLLRYPSTEHERDAVRHLLLWMSLHEAKTDYFLRLLKIMKGPG